MQKSHLAFLHRHLKIITNPELQHMEYEKKLIAKEENFKRRI